MQQYKQKFTALGTNPGAVVWFMAPLSSQCQGFIDKTFLYCTILVKTSKTSQVKMSYFQYFQRFRWSKTSQEKTTYFR
jgi:hypothetical protein